jgi:[acyl-carrier-protein] S-malonyltransferase
MNKTAFLFSGQGSQYAGMGRELCENFKAAKTVYDQASSHFGYDVLKFSSEADENELAKTGVSQPLIFTHSTAANAVLAEYGITAEAVAGFSLGEVSALTAAGVMDIETGFTVIAQRAAAMQSAAENSNGVMFAVLGLQNNDVERLCEAAYASTGGYVVPVNYNCPGQVVIAGEEEAAQSAAQSLGSAGAKVVKLAVNAAFHSKLMSAAAGQFYDKISGIAFNRPNKTVYSNVTGDKIELSDVAEYLKTQMTSPVRFNDEMLSLSRDGFDSFIEFGPGKTLCGFIKRGIKGATSYRVDDLKSAVQCLEAFGHKISQS